MARTATMTARETLLVTAIGTVLLAGAGVLNASAETYDNLITAAGSPHRSEPLYASEKVFEGMGLDLTGGPGEVPKEALERIYAKRIRELQPDFVILDEGSAVRAVVPKYVTTMTEGELPDGNLELVPGTGPGVAVELVETVIDALRAEAPSVTIRMPKLKDVPAYYYAIGLVSAHVNGPARRYALEYEIPGLKAACLQNANGGTVFVLLNTGDEPIHCLYYHQRQTRYRQYNCSLAEPPVNAFADLPRFEDKYIAFAKRRPNPLTIPGKTLVILLQEGTAGVTGRNISDSPERVYNVDVSDTEDGAKRLAWEPVAEHDACYYRVYRMNMPRYRFARKQHIGSTGGTTWMDEDVPEGKRAYYAVIAVDRFGNVSE